MLRDKTEIVFEPVWQPEAELLVYFVYNFYRKSTKKEITIWFLNIFSFTNCSFNSTEKYILLISFLTKNKQKNYWMNGLNNFEQNALIPNCLCLKYFKNFFFLWKLCFYDLGYKILKLTIFWRTFLIDLVLRSW